MRTSFAQIALLGLFMTGASGSDDAARPPGQPRFAHASLSAYPNAVICVKDAKSGMTFYVESDGRRLVALDRDGRLAWGVDVLGETRGERVPGGPVVRHLRLDPGAGRIEATSGKADHFFIETKSGKVTYAGSD